MTPWPLDDLTSRNNIERIIDIEANVVRNLLITQSYHELAMAMAQHLDRDNVHWCAFATWASKQAGAFIRNEEIPTWLRRFLQLDIARPDTQGHDDALANWLHSLPLVQYIRRVVEDINGSATACTLLWITSVRANKRSTYSTRRFMPSRL